MLEKVLDDAVALAKEQIEAKNPNLANKDQVAEDSSYTFQDPRSELLDFLLIIPYLLRSRRLHPSYRCRKLHS